jgi:hypothetical protein
MKSHIILPLLLLSLLPITLFAQGQGLDSVQVDKLGGFIDNFNSRVVASVGVLLLSLAIVTFFAGMVRFIWSMREGDGKSAETGRRFMLWGLLGVFVIFSVYGIVFFFQRTLGISDSVTIPKPCLNFITDCKSSAGTWLTPNKPNVGGGGGNTGGGTPSGLPLGTMACRNIQGSISEEDGKCYTGAVGSVCFGGCSISSNGSVIDPQGRSGGGTGGGGGSSTKKFYSCSDFRNLDKACKVASGREGLCKYVNADDAINLEPGQVAQLYCAE